MFELEAAQRQAVIMQFVTKVNRFIRSDMPGFPHITKEGRWVTTADGWWTGGFWVGQLWWLWKYTGDTAFRSAAERYLSLLEPRKDAATIDFDLGFLYAYGFALGHRVTGEITYRRVALEAAERLLSLVHPATGLIYQVYPQRVVRYGAHVASSIIDVMMNLTLLWWAYEQTGDSRYRDVARQHAHKTAEWVVRPDGSTAHVVDFDAQTGQLLRLDTHQGYASNSCWARGQAWAIYGFLQAFHYTGEEAFLKIFYRLLTYWTNHVPADGVPYWDFDAPPDSQHVRDTSAAAIVLAALAQARRWQTPILTADMLEERTWQGLFQNYLAPDDEDGVLTDGCFHYPRGEGISAATVWGDYYLLEALDDLRIRHARIGHILREKEGKRMDSLRNRKEI